MNALKKTVLVVCALISTNVSLHAFIKEEAVRPEQPREIEQLSDQQCEDHFEGRIEYKFASDEARNEHNRWMQTKCANWLERSTHKKSSMAKQSRANL